VGGDWPQQRAEQAVGLTLPKHVGPIARHAGISPAQTYLDYNGRPLYLLDHREKIAKLV
jgi:hypothetical protein